MNLTEYSKCHTHHERVAFIFAHISLFIIFVWFGFLKIVGVSPADELVNNLLVVTLPWISFNTFFVLLGSFEVFLGILFLVPRMERVAIILLVPHMTATLAPLFVLPDIVWAGFGVPTLEGQYILKNIVIVALAISILVDLKQRRRHPHNQHSHTE